MIGSFPFKVHLLGLFQEAVLIEMQLREPSDQVEVST